MQINRPKFLYFLFLQKPKPENNKFTDNKLHYTTQLFSPLGFSDVNSTTYVQNIHHPVSHKLHYICTGSLFITLSCFSLALCMTVLYLLYLCLDRLHCNCASGFKTQWKVVLEKQIQVVFQADREKKELL